MDTSEKNLLSDQMEPTQTPMMKEQMSQEREIVIS
jgi:hypothetical protein